MSLEDKQRNIMFADTWTFQANGSKLQENLKMKKKWCDSKK